MWLYFVSVSYNRNFSVTHFSLSCRITIQTSSLQHFFKIVCLLKWLHRVVRWHCWHTCLLQPRGRRQRQWTTGGSLSPLVSSPCLIYCPATFEVGQAEFTSLSHFVISRPRLQPRWGPSPSATGYRKYPSLIAPGHWIGTSSPNDCVCSKLFQRTVTLCFHMMAYTDSP